jgi:hypothetical protein
MTQLILERASASRPSGEWSEDDYDVLAEARAASRAQQPETPSRLGQRCAGLAPDSALPRRREA